MLVLAITVLKNAQVGFQRGVSLLMLPGLQVSINLWELRMKERGEDSGEVVSIVYGLIRLHV